MHCEGMSLLESTIKCALSLCYSFWYLSQLLFFTLKLKGSILLMLVFPNGICNLALNFSGQKPRFDWETPIGSKAAPNCLPYRPSSMIWPRHSLCEPPHWCFPVSDCRTNTTVVCMAKDTEIINPCSLPSATWIWVRYGQSNWSEVQETFRVGRAGQS